MKKDALKHRREAMRTNHEDNFRRAAIQPEFLENSDHEFLHDLALDWLTDCGIDTDDVSEIGVTVIIEWRES